MQCAKEVFSFIATKKIECQLKHPNKNIQKLRRNTISNFMYAFEKFIQSNYEWLYSN